jgi:outer membrane immunogenic protein
MVSVALPAFATDLGTRMRVKAPVAPEPVPSWAGYYIGVNGGYAWGHGRGSATVDPAGIPLPAPWVASAPVPAPFAFGIGDSHGGFGGLQLGANAQNGRFVYGLEADLQFGSIKGDGSTDFQFAAQNPDQGLFVGNASLSQKLDWFSTLRGRIGYDFNPVLVYLTGGLAIGHINSTLSLNGTTYDTGGGGMVFVANTSGSASASKTHIGYALGAGLETPLSPGWTLRGEYLFMSFDQSTTLSVAGATATTSGLDVHLVRAGLNYKFGGPAAAR